MKASAAAVIAGTLPACQSTGASPGTAAANTAGACFPGDSKAAALPSSNTPYCTDQIDVVNLPPDAARFSAWNDILKQASPGRESGFIDLAAVDHNLKLVGQKLGAGINLRFVAKSLPCLELLEYMMVTACTNRVMAFSEGMVRDLLCRFGSNVDILLGRPATADAARRVFATLDVQAQGNNPAGDVRWLVDTVERMQDFAALAEERQAPINISVEIDVGLRRGGARTETELLNMMTVIKQSSYLQFTGFMGYEGHIPFAAMGNSTPDAEFQSVQQRYNSFVAAARQAYPDLFDGPLVLNSGGSRTYHYYTDDADTPVNDVAMGSAFFYPSHFHNIPEQALRSATFFASPILKRLDPAETPFDENFLPNLAADNPMLQVAHFMTGGDFPGSQVYPPGMTKDIGIGQAPATPRVVNMLPNQGRWLGERALSLDVGDFIFYQPWEGDAIRWLRYVDVFRGADLVDQWPTFQPGIALPGIAQSGIAQSGIAQSGIAR